MKLKEIKGFALEYLISVNINTGGHSETPDDQHAQRDWDAQTSKNMNPIEDTSDSAETFDTPRCYICECSLRVHNSSVIVESMLTINSIGVVHLFS